MAGELNPFGVDLNHHLIPDPVAGAIHCLLDRIRFLEKEIGKGACAPDGESLEEECTDCDAKEVCETDAQQSYLQETKDEATNVNTMLRNTG
jgi:serine O-acetyltransferase